LDAGGAGPLFGLPFGKEAADGKATALDRHSFADGFEVAEGGLGEFELVEEAVEVVGVGVLGIEFAEGAAGFGFDDGEFVVNAIGDVMGSFGDDLENLTIFGGIEPVDRGFLVAAFLEDAGLHLVEVFDDFGDEGMFVLDFPQKALGDAFENGDFVTDFVVHGPIKEFGVDAAVVGVAEEVVGSLGGGVEGDRVPGVVVAGGSFVDLLEEVDRGVPIEAVGD